MTPSAVSSARALVRRTAAPKAASTERWNRPPCRFSSVKAWTVWIAFSVSPARPLESAIPSWASRDSLRTSRPTRISGAMTTGTSSTIHPVRLGLVSASMTSAPIRLIAERSAMEMPEPAIDCTSVVSVVSRDRTSPVRVISKKAGSSRTTLR